jgi:pyruvate/2-oxoglutarate dehydrogenase complex dihydrolipoamide acyltransferase (E2) component
MSKQAPVYEVKPFPLSRRVIGDSARAYRRRNTILGLVEVDVTEARRIIRAHKEHTGESLSFTAFIIACLGKAIDQNRYLHARRDFWGRLILFEEVDCATAARFAQRFKELIERGEGLALESEEQLAWVQHEKTGCATGIKA